MRKTAIFLLFLIIGFTCTQEKKNSLNLKKSGNKYTNLQEALKKPKEVYKLDLSGKYQVRKSTLEDAKTIFIELEDLNIDIRLSLTELPSGVGNLTELRELDVNTNLLGKLPNEIGRLRKIQILSLSYNELKRIPYSIGNLTKLEQLRLDNNKLIQLPTEIRMLVNLKLLDLYNNKLNNIPSGIGKLIQLEELDLRKNHLTHLPIEIVNLKNLHYLYLSGNLLSIREKQKIKKLLPHCEIVF